MSAFEVVTRGQRDMLGEGPIWCAGERAIYWVDIMKPALNRFSLMDGSTATWPMPEMIGWVVERQTRPGFIAGFESGFAELMLDPVTIRPLGDPEPHFENSRMNDAKVDPEGRIWAGTMDTDAARPVGALYRFDANHIWHRMDDGYLVTNGPTFSPDGRYLYHADSFRKVIYRFDLEPDGGVSNKQTLITFEDGWGYPDGMTTDVEGCLWVAHFAAGRVSRFTPDGQVERVVLLPTSQVTSVVFAGDQLDRMFVTSAADGLVHDTLAGELFEIDPGVRGLAPVKFAG